MSGIVGIVNLDGAPVDERLLARMTASIAFRGPDARRTWVNGPAGLGHTLLQTTYESEFERQPFSLDRQCFIVADCRIDARTELVAQLREQGREVSRGQPDVELILHAWHAWGPDCVLHLLGDFAFAIWDRTAGRLFCARDQLGVKSLFYARVGQSVVFSNTLDCIRQHPAVSDRLNEGAIGDFLLFDMNQDPETTFFADIRRVPPAHQATWTATEQRVTHYWTLPVDEPIFFRRKADYTERFNELLAAAVTDRLRTDRVGVFMDGLDASALAAVACRVLRRRSVPNGVHAFTTVVDGPGSFDRQQYRHAHLVARHLDIPVSVRVRSRMLADATGPVTRIGMPEPPWDETTLTSDRTEYDRVAQHSRVALHGERRLVGDVTGRMVTHRRIPLVGTIPRMIGRRSRQEQEREPYPTWLEPGFESRLRLRSRWEDRKAHSALLGLQQEALFRSLDAEVTRSTLEVRHPFVDLQLLRYMLAVPAVPWHRTEFIVRRAMRDELPPAVLKAPRGRDAKAADGQMMLPFVATEQCRSYIVPAKVPVAARPRPNGLDASLRPRVLNQWLNSVRPRRQVV